MSQAQVTGEIQPAHSGVDVLVQYRRPGGNWSTAQVVQSNATGQYASQFMLPETGIWEVQTRVDDTEDADHIGDTSATRLIDVMG